VRRARGLLRLRLGYRLVLGIVLRQLGICLVVGLRCGVVGFRLLGRTLLLARVLLLVLLLGGLFLILVGFLRGLFADRDAVVETKHDHDHVGFLGGEHALGGHGPVGGLALGLGLDQARGV